MTQPIPQNNLSKNSLGLIGAGVGIITCWAFINWYPDKVGKWINKEPWATVFTGLQVLLFILSIASVITVASLIARSIRGKRISLKYKGFDLSVQDTEITLKQEDSI